MLNAIAFVSVFLIITLFISFMVVKDVKKVN